jgi:hypothetical protein
MIEIALNKVNKNYGFNNLLTDVSFITFATGFSGTKYKSSSCAISDAGTSIKSVTNRFFMLFVFYLFNLFDIKLVQWINAFY